jgi:hypothetical protein
MLFFKKHKDFSTISSIHQTIAGRKRFYREVGIELDTATAHVIYNLCKLVSLKYELFIDIADQIF